MTDKLVYQYHKQLQAKMAVFLNITIKLGSISRVISIDMKIFNIQTLHISSINGYASIITSRPFLSFIFMFLRTELVCEIMRAWNKIPLAQRRRRLVEVYNCRGFIQVTNYLD